MAGRPKIGDGTVSKVRLGALLPRVRALAKAEGVSEAEAIRRLVARGLTTPPDAG